MPGDFLLLGRVDRVPLDARRLRERWEMEPRVRADFERLGMGGWAGMLGLFVLGEEDAARLAAGARLNTDDRLPLEFGAPRALYLETSLPNRAMVASFRSADLPALTPESAPLMDQRGNRYWVGVGCLRRGDPAAALAHFERVLQLDPTHTPAAIAAAMAALQLGRPAPALDFAQRALARPPAPPAALFLAGVSAWWLGIMPPLWREASVGKLAVNAVMAGCDPAYFPVIVAAVRALLEPAFNLYGVQATTHPVAPLLVVSGPVAGAIGMHAGSGLFGPGFRANATIGRALRLILMNVGGGWPGRHDMATQGSPAKFSFADR